jgi:hypothetical protein
VNLYGWVDTSLGEVAVTFLVQRRGNWSNTLIYVKVGDTVLYSTSDNYPQGFDPHDGNFYRYWWLRDLEGNTKVYAVQLDSNTDRDGHAVLRNGDDEDVAVRRHEFRNRGNFDDVAVFLHGGDCLVPMSIRVHYRRIAP